MIKFKDCGLPSNACAAKNCKFYLIPRDKMARHFDIWGNLLPFQFH